MSYHDPNRQVSYLQQCLSSDKKPLGLFIGAGCPLSVRVHGGPLIQDIRGITNAIREKAKTNADIGSSLAAVEKNLKDDGNSDATIEDILSHIRLLRSVAGCSSIRGLAAVDLDKLDCAICDHIHEIVETSLPNELTPYHTVARWAGGTSRELPISIFTTNYDLLMEQALEDVGSTYFDGFTGSRRPFFDIQSIEEDTLPSRWTRLWKLHGSCNWFQTNNGKVTRGIRGEPSDERRLIHPSHLKYQDSRRLPYLVMMDRLRDHLKQPTAVLILCGYSFGDEHINEVIMQGLQASPSSVAFALQFGPLDQYATACDLARSRSNLSVLATDCAVIGGRRGAWPSSESEVTSSSVGIEWHQESDRWSSKITLGDFAEFAKLLAGTIGHPLESRDIVNV